MTYIRLTPAQRFWGFVKRTRTCWLWTGHVAKSGYGQFALAHRTAVRAHRFSYELHFGTIAAGAFVLHRCDNPRCVRPDHLSVGDAAANLRDARQKRRRHSLQLTGACRRGHPFTPENFYRFKNGRWYQCRRCRALTRPRPSGRRTTEDMRRTH